MQHRGPLLEPCFVGWCCGKNFRLGFRQHGPQRHRERYERLIEIRGVVYFGSCDRLARPSPASGTGAGSSKRLTGWRWLLPLAGVVSATLPAQGPGITIPAEFEEQIYCDEDGSLRVTIMWRPSPPWSLVNRDPIIRPGRRRGRWRAKSSARIHRSIACGREGRTPSWASASSPEPRP
jgi:hypothetical protein